MGGSSVPILYKFKVLIINTFASQRLVFEEKNTPFLLESASKLTHEFLYDNFIKNFFVKKVIQKFMC